MADFHLPKLRIMYSPIALRFDQKPRDYTKEVYGVTATGHNFPNTLVNSSLVYDTKTGIARGRGRF